MAMLTGVFMSGLAAHRCVHVRVGCSQVCSCQGWLLTGVFMSGLAAHRCVHVRVGCSQVCSCQGWQVLVECRRLVIVRWMIEQNSPKNYCCTQQPPKATVNDTVKHRWLWCRCCQQFHFTVALLKWRPAKDLLILYHPSRRHKQWVALEWCFVIFFLICGHFSACCWYWYIYITSLRNMLHRLSWTLFKQISSNNITCLVKNYVYCTVFAHICMLFILNDHSIIMCTMAWL